MDIFEKIRSGEISIKHDSTARDLRRVLEHVFPRDPSSSSAFGDCEFYIADKENPLYFKGTTIKKSPSKTTRSLIRLLNEQKFKELSTPLISFLNEHYHAHATIIINTSSAELLLGEISCVDLSHIKD